MKFNNYLLLYVAPNKTATYFKPSRDKFSNIKVIP